MRRLGVLRTFARGRQTLANRIRSEPYRKAMPLDFTRIVEFCIRRRWLIILASALALAASTVYVARNFALNTNVNALLSPHLPWRQRQ